MKYIIIGFLLLPVLGWAEGIVVYDTLTNAVKQFRYGDPSTVAGRDDVLVFNEAEVANLPSSSIPLKHWLVVGSSVIEMSQAQKDSTDNAIAQADTLANRVGAKGFIDGFADFPLYERAKIDLILREINILRAQHSLADRTLAQFKTAIKNKIDSGDVDSQVSVLNTNNLLLASVGGAAGSVLTLLIGFLRKRRK